MNPQWTAPDVGAPLTFADYAAGRDPALKAALAYEPGRPLLRAAIREAVVARGWDEVPRAIAAFTDRPENRCADVELELLEAGVSFLRERRPDDWRKALELAIQRFPLSARSHYWLATVHKNDRPDEARRLVAIALRLDPTHDRAKVLAEELGMPPQR